MRRVITVERAVDPRRDGLDADRVAPRLYVGAYCPDDSKIAAAGFTHVIRVAQELELCEFPMDDAPLTRQQADTARRAAGAVCEALGKGGRVLVTCAMGLNRSALVAALAIIKFYGISPVQAIAQVRAGRRAPPGGPGVLSNHSFVAFLTMHTMRLVK